MTGKEQDLTLVGFLFQHFQGFFEPLVIKADQGIVQDQGSLGRQLPGHR